MRHSWLLGSCVLAAAGAALAFGSLNVGCDVVQQTSTGGSGGSTSTATTSGTGGAGGVGPGKLPPGEVCTDPELNLVQVRAMPSTIFLPPCAAGAKGCTTRQVRVVVDPDACSASTISFSTGDASVVAAPEDQTFYVHKNEATVTLQGGAQSGHTTLTVFADVVGSMGPVGGSCKTDTDCTTPGTVCHASACVATTTVDVYVNGDPVTCAVSKEDSASTPSLSGGDTLALPKGIATIGLPVGANDPDQGSFLWGVTPFPATLACAAPLALSGYTALGPAITFGPVATTFQREIPLSVPINPALMPSAARLRHLRVAYSGPAFKAPRVIPVADLRILSVPTDTACTSDAACSAVYPASSCDPTAHVCDQWQLTFKAPRLGTYQAVVAPDAGTNTFSRTMTHRAVMGISMGGGGAASFGLRHHNLIDVLAPLGGPVDWTWMLNFIATSNLGGFQPIPHGTTLKDIQLTSTPCMTNADCQADETCMGVVASPMMAGECILLPTIDEPYVHAETFNKWWYEFPKGGNGGDFDRGEYAQIFRDLAIMYGNPNGQNNSVGGENLPAGVPPTDLSVVGSEGNCGVTVDPVCPVPPAPTPWPNGEVVPNDPGIPPATCTQLAAQQTAWNDCPADRCSHTLTLNNYFDASFNPDGIFPVITVCDGSPQNPALSPWSNTWTSMGNGFPLEVGLAVDYNGNGVRDELEPMIGQGHEPWSDYGTDGIPDAMEPGYQPGVNDDPNGDDYNCQYNPTGTENDHRYETGEPFQDDGLDGVPNTPQQPATGWAKPGDGYDVGEGDGQFTVSRGLQNFWDRDAHSILRQMVDPAQVPGGALDDAALSRLDCWTDGGLRDLFNFEVDAQHLVGAWAARGRLATYLTWFTEAPDLDPTQPNYYDPKLIDYADLPGVVLQRYGHIDPSPTDIADGSGQHVGTASELTSRLQSALYFIGSRWADHPELRLQVAPSSDNPAPGAAMCEIIGTCTLAFTSSAGRTGPVGISLPPGYANADLQYIRYPVIYLLHGYGQSPTDLEAAIALLNNWWNSPLDSGSSRLAKSIVVYVDGRCRPNPDGTSECLQGTFFADSPLPGGAQDESWWLELMSYMDANYRTLGQTSVEWTE